MPSIRLSDAVRATHMGTRRARTLMKSEEWWRDHYFDIERHGYKLPPRFRPLWKPLGKAFFSVEDYQPTITKSVMRNVRFQDGSRVILRILPEEGMNPQISKLFSFEELGGDRRKYCLVVEQYRWVLQPPPDKLHPTLSSWLKNITKLDGLINHFQDLASSASIDHRSQLLNKVAALRATFKKQQERCIKFLQLSEDYANKYLLDIDSEIRQQRTLLANLEERLEAAKKLHGDAVDLQMLYESRTVASMDDLLATGVPRPLPQDDALFKEVDLVMAEIRRSYEELNKFWREEVSHVVEALQKRRIDPRDFERWNSFRSSLKQTIKFWRNRPPSGDSQTLRSNNTSPSTGLDLGAISSSLSSTSGSFGEALERIYSSASLQYSLLSWTPFERVYTVFEANSDLCLSYLRHCVDYGEKVLTWCLPFNALPISSPVGAPHASDLRERSARLLSESIGISTENIASVKGSLRCKITYKKASALEQKTTSELTTLFESLSSWVATIDGPSDDAPTDVAHPRELDELKCAWEKTRDSLRSALETLTSEPVHHHRPSLVFMHCRSALRRWMTSLV